MIISASLVPLLLEALVAALFIKAVSIIYSAYLSPLSRIPGPRLAALTGWYEAYYDFYLDGKWPQQLVKLHEQYGPVVRINPREVHVQDPDFTSRLYNTRFDKDPVWLASLGQDQLSAGTTPDHATHHARRAPLNPFFSRNGILSRIDTINSTVDQMCSRLREYADGETVVRLDDVYTALTLDIIGLFCYGREYKYLQRKNFGADWRVMVAKIFETPALFRTFPALGFLVKCIPPSIAKSLNPSLKELINLQEDCRANIQQVMREWDDGPKRQQQSNVFTSLLASDLPPAEKRIDRLIPEGVLLIAAGSDTTARALSNISYHLFKHAHAMRQVRGELERLQISGKPLTWINLEPLPWLSAVVKEGSRLAGGISSRSPRVVSHDMAYAGHVIPAGTVVSQTMFLLLMDPRTFPEPRSFRPERWLIEGPDGQLSINKRMNEHLVVWAKGPRMCLGIWLSQAEMYTVIARLVMEFDLELFQTDDSDVAMARDKFLPSPKDDSKGVRAHLKLRTSRV